MDGVEDIEDMAVDVEDMAVDVEGNEEDTEEEIVVIDREVELARLVVAVVVWFVSADEKVREFGLRTREALPR